MMSSGICEAAKKTKTNAKTPFAKITDARFNKKKLKKNEVFEYSFKISLVDSFNYKSKDLVNGSFSARGSYDYVIVNWKSSKKQKVVQTFKWKTSKKTKTVKGKIPIYPGMQTGKWKIDSIEIWNYSDESECDTGILVIMNGNKNKQKKTTGHYWTNLSFADFKVKGKRKPDKKAPTFDKETLSISKDKVESGEKVKFSVKVKDESKIEKVTCGWEVTTSYDEVWDLSKEMKYNKKTQSYECTLVLNDDVQMRLVDIHTKDMYGNSKTYTDWCESECEHGRKSEFHDSFSKMVIYKK